MSRPDDHNQPGGAGRWDDDADGWFSGGYDAAHQHCLDELGLVNAVVDADDPDAVVEMPTAEMLQAAQLHVAGLSPTGLGDQPGDRSVHEHRAVRPAAVDADPYARYAEIEMPDEMRQAAQRDIEQPRPAGTPDDPAAIAARIQEIRDRLHAQALDEYAAHQRAAGPGDDQHDGHQNDERGWQR